jgi:hypothetical protein
MIRKPVPMKPAMREENNFIYFYNTDERINLPFSEGGSVAFQIGYAFTFNNPIYIMEPLHDVNDYPVEAVSKGSLSPEELVKHLRNESLKRSN